jgi:hypothetical protein
MTIVFAKVVIKACRFMIYSDYARELAATLSSQREQRMQLNCCSHLQYSFRLYAMSRGKFSHQS